MEIITTEVRNMDTVSRFPQKDHLKDIRSVNIDEAQPLPARIRSFVQQIGDPYHFKVGDVVVTVCYSDNGCTLTQRFSEMLTLMG